MKIFGIYYDKNYYFYHLLAWQIPKSFNDEEKDIIEICRYGSLLIETVARAFFPKLKDIEFLQKVMDYIKAFRLEAKKYNVSFNLIAKKCNVSLGEDKTE